MAQQRRRRKESRAARRKRIMRNRLMALGALVVIIIIIIVIIVSCSAGKKDKTSSATTDAVVAEEMADGEDAAATEETTIAAKDIANEKPIQLYTIDYGTMTCTKATSIDKAWTPSEDLVSLGAFCSKENSFTFESETQAHSATWNTVNTVTKYKIGYELSFDLNGESKVITILKPGDIESNSDLFMGDYPDDGDYSNITGYLGVWVYDDLNQEPGSFYIHLSQSEYTDNSLLTSIKLRPTPQSDEISNLVVKGFSYSSDAEFDSDGHYIGNYAATVTFNK